MLSSFLQDTGLGTEVDWQKLANYRDALYVANATRNLTRVPKEEFEVRHAVDSLLVGRLVQECESILDIGTGPGLPGWMLAWLWPRKRIVGVESNGKMAEFANQVPVGQFRIVQSRMEELDWVEEFDGVTGRAVAPLSAQLELSATACKIGGLVVPFRVPAERSSIESFNAGRLGLELLFVQEVPLPATAISRLFPVYKKVRPTPPEFPRPWARIKARPL